MPSCCFNALNAATSHTCYQSIRLLLGNLAPFLYPYHLEIVDCINPDSSWGSFSAQNVPHVFEWVQMHDTLMTFCDPKWFPMQTR